MKLYRIILTAAFTLFVGTMSSAAYALELDLWGLMLQNNHKLTLGAQWRMEERDIDLIGKLNVEGQQNLCSDGTGNGDDCISLHGDPEPNQRLVNAQGGLFAALNDDGNLNYDKYDLVSSIAKVASDWEVEWEGWLLKASTISFFDETNSGFNVTHVNTQYQPASEKRVGSIERKIGVDIQLREVNLSREFETEERLFLLTIGSQRVRWGEANLHLFNTLDAINPLDAVLALQPGFDLSQLAVPTYMVSLSGDVIENVTAEAFYQLEWNGVRVQPSGTFFSSQDAVGVEQYFPVLGLGQFPEDPTSRFEPAQPFRQFSSSIRTSRAAEEENEPKDAGQYGFRVNWYAADLNGGTEIAFYAMNYHSRLPYFSIEATDITCVRGAGGSFATALQLCQGFNGREGPFQGGLEPLPVDTAGLIVDYPEDIQMYGISFNTTWEGWAITGEYAYRPNMPIQILISDVFYAGQQNSFAEQDIPLNPAGVNCAVLPPGIAQDNCNAAVGAAVGGAFAGVNQDTIIPAARTFIPDLLSTFRGVDVNSAAAPYAPGQYIPGFERLGVGQFVISGLKLFPNIIGADNLIFLVEAGFTHVVDMPDEDELVFQGRIESTHPSPGADCTGFAAGTDCATATVTARINPTQQTDGFADDFSAGLRALFQLEYTNLWNSGINLKPTLVWMEDVYGIAPFPAQNYVEGNRWVIPGFQWEYGVEFSGTLLYQHFAGDDNPLRDRDNLSVSVAYSF